MFTNPCEWHHLVLGSCSQTDRERSSTERSIQIQALSSHSLEPADLDTSREKYAKYLPPSTTPCPPPIISAPLPVLESLVTSSPSVHISIMPLKSPTGYKTQGGLRWREQNRKMHDKEKQHAYRNHWAFVKRQKFKTFWTRQSDVASVLLFSHNPSK